MKFEIDIELSIDGTSLGMKKFVQAATLIVLQKRAIILIKRRIREARQYMRD